VAPDGPTAAVTLHTGDRVTAAVDGRHYAVQQGPGRADVQFASWQSGDHLTVVPTDALWLPGAGRLDSRLFDITLLRQFGYDQRRDLPLILEASQPPAARTTLRAADASTEVDLPAIIARWVIGRPAFSATCSPASNQNIVTAAASTRRWWSRSRQRPENRPATDIDKTLRVGPGLRAKDLCRALGFGTELKDTEGIRAKLKRLVNRQILIAFLRRREICYFRSGPQLVE